MSYSDETYFNYLSDVYAELVDLALDKRIYGNEEFDRGYVAGLRSVLQMIYAQSLAFGVTLQSGANRNFDLGLWLNDPYKYVFGCERPA